VFFACIGYENLEILSSGVNILLLLILNWQASVGGDCVSPLEVVGMGAWFVKNGTRELAFYHKEALVEVCTIADGSTMTDIELSMLSGERLTFVFDSSGFGNDDVSGSS